MPPEELCRRWIVTGRVQGVGFRWFAAKQAERLGLAGWVRNLDDGSVEVVARGNPREIADLEAALNRGPHGAHVTHLSSTDVPHELVEDKSFRVMR